MPPRDDVGNAKTTKAMAKIVEDVGTPDSVIRKLFALASNATDSIGSSPNPEQVGTVTKGRGRSAETDFDDNEECFRFPVATPSQVDSSIDSDESSEGFARFSLSLMQPPISSTSPPLSPTPMLRSGAAVAASLGNLTAPSETSSGSTLPPLLTNCNVCGKQFISEKHLEDHSNFCRPITGGLTGVAPPNDLNIARESQMSIASSSVASNAPFGTSSLSEKFSESPALPLYIQRAIERGTNSASTERSDTPIPSANQQIAPPPMTAATPVSPSIVASPNDFRASLNGGDGTEDGFEDEISTFLECLKSDLGGCPPRSSTPVEELFSDRQKMWASRRHRSSPPTDQGKQFAMRKLPSEHSLQVSSDEDESAAPTTITVPSSARLRLVPVTDSNQLSSIGSASSVSAGSTCSNGGGGGLLLPPLGPPLSSSPPPPPIPGPLLSLTSNMSLNSPIQERSSFEIEPSYISASFLNGAPSPPEVSVPSVPIVSSSTNFAGRASPTFGTSLSNRTSFESSVDSGRLRSSLPAVITDSSVTLMRLSGAASPSVSSSLASLDTSSTTRCPCKFCGRKFATQARLERHENVCEKVFGNRRPRATSLDQSSTSSSINRSRSNQSQSLTASAVSCKHCGRTFSHVDKLNRHEHVCVSVFKPAAAQPTSRDRSRSNVSADDSSSLRTVIDYPNSRPSLRQVSSELVWIPPKNRRNFSVQSFSNLVVIGSEVRPPVAPPRRNSQSFSILSSSVSSSRDESVTSSLGRSSLEFQYNLLREQIRSCSARLKQRQVDQVYRRDG